MKMIMKVFANLFKLTLLCVLTLGIAGCGKKTAGQNGEGGMNGEGSGDYQQFYGMNLTPEQEAELLNRCTYYFGYDQFDLQESDVMSIYAHAKKICSNPNARVRIEGHTDERGSREYNVALGERRAKAVANILMSKGVNARQLNVVSYGKEKPAVFGHDESAWSQNRRAVIVYEQE